jgi:hypothetical protein
MVDSSKLSVQVSRIYHTQTTHIHENKQQTADYQKKNYYMIPWMRKMNQQRVYPASYVTIYATHNMFKRAGRAVAPFLQLDQESLFLSPFYNYSCRKNSFLKDKLAVSFHRINKETCTSDSEVVSFISFSHRIFTIFTHYLHTVRIWNSTCC